MLPLALRRSSLRSSSSTGGMGPPAPGRPPGYQAWTRGRGAPTGPAAKHGDACLAGTYPNSLFSLNKKTKKKLLHMRPFLQKGGLRNQCEAFGRGKGECKGEWDSEREERRPWVRRRLAGSTVTPHSLGRGGGGGEEGGWEGLTERKRGGPGYDRKPGGATETPHSLGREKRSSRMAA